MGTTMLQQIEKTKISIPKKQRRILRQLAQQAGQNIDEFIEQLLSEGIRKRQETTSYETKRIRFHAFAEIEEHRKRFLAKRNNQPLTIDTISLIEQIREEHDFNILTSTPLHCD